MEDKDTFGGEDLPDFRKYHVGIAAVLKHIDQNDQVELEGGHEVFDGGVLKLNLAPANPPYGERIDGFTELGQRGSPGTKGIRRPEPKQPAEPPVPIPAEWMAYVVSDERIEQMDMGCVRHVENQPQVRERAAAELDRALEPHSRERRISRETQSVKAIAVVDGGAATLEPSLAFVVLRLTPAHFVYAGHAFARLVEPGIVVFTQGVQCPFALENMDIAANEQGFVRLSHTVTLSSTGTRLPVSMGPS